LWQTGNGKPTSLSGSESGSQSVPGLGLSIWVRGLLDRDSEADSDSDPDGGGGRHLLKQSGLTELLHSPLCRQLETNFAVGIGIGVAIGTGPRAQHLEAWLVRLR